MVPDPSKPPLPPGATAAAGFWEARYRARDTGWDIAQAAPPIVEWFSGPGAPPPGQRVLVPGAGRGHDALFLAQRGDRVLAVDFAAPALAALRRRRRALGLAPDRCRTLRADVLKLGKRFAGQFDLLVEYTCYCAIDPGDRDAYAAMAAQVLRPGGLLVGLFFPFRTGTPGPPFPVSGPEIRERFAADFEVETWITPTSSIERRQGEERLVVFRRRG